MKRFIGVSMLMAVGALVLASAALAMTHARATRIMHGTVAEECPGGNGAICLQRNDANVPVYYDRSCWRWRADYTHKEGIIPFWPYGARWYGSTGTICSGVVRHHEYRD